MNLIEYAFGLNPTTPSTGQLPSVQYGTGSAVGVTYGADWSTDLLNWTPITDTGTGGQHIFIFPTTGEVRMFMRLRVTAP